jgi:hypothetical protein
VEAGGAGGLGVKFSGKKYQNGEDDKTHR